MGNACLATDYKTPKEIVIQRKRPLDFDVIAKSMKESEVMESENQELQRKLKSL